MGGGGIGVVGGGARFRILWGEGGIGVGRFSKLGGGKV